MRTNRRMMVELAVVALGSLAVADAAVSKAFGMQLLGQPAQEVPSQTAQEAPTPPPEPARQVVARYALTGAAPVLLSPASADACFEPCLDTVASPSVYTARTPAGGTVAREDVRRAGLRGAVLLAGYWYQSVVRPRLLGAPGLLAPAADEADGVRYLAAQLGPRGAETVAEGLRLRSLSQPPRGGAVDRAAIAYEDYHDALGPREVPAAELEGAVELIRRRLDRDGVAPFFYQCYKVSRSFFGQSRTLHALSIGLIYRCQEVRAAQPGGPEQAAWKLDYYDPYFTPTTPLADSSAEGTGAYLLYFPATKQMTFSAKMISSYEGLQATSPVLDDTDVSLGLYDVEPGTDDFAAIGRRAFLEGHVGCGVKLDIEQVRTLCGGGTLSVPAATLD